MNKAKSMYEAIKKQNGEAFAQGIRRFDSGIFDIPNLDKVVKFAGRNAMPILSFLSGLRHNLKKKEKVISSKTPYELLKEAGYEAFYVDSLEKQNLIEPYFVDGEALCTFSDKNRYIDHHIIHCVKRGAEKLKRSDFKNPKREDEYGVSVISIQILKKGGFVKITNRYNHSVENPDNTFGSNPDNIVLGLTFALERQFKMKLNCFQNVPEGYVFQKGCLFKFHTERENCYIGENFFVADGNSHSFNKDYEVVADCFVFNLKEQTISSLIEPVKELNDLTNQMIFLDEMKGKKLTITKKEDIYYLMLNNKPFLGIKDGAIVEIYLEKSKEAVHVEQFQHLKKLVLKNVKEVGMEFIADNNTIEELIAPKLKSASDFFIHNSALKRLEIPSLEVVGCHSFCHNSKLEELVLNKLNVVGEGSCSSNPNLKVLKLNKVLSVEEGFCNKNPKLKILEMDMLEEAYTNNFNQNDELEVLSLKSLREVGCDSFCAMSSLRNVNLPSLISLEGDSFYALPELKIFNAPLLETIQGSNCLSFTGLEEVCLPALEQVRGKFLDGNQGLRRVELPKLKKGNISKYKICSEKTGLTSLKKKQKERSYE